MVVSSRSMPALIALLREPILLPFVIPVLFNICVDYGMSFIDIPNIRNANGVKEPAQKLASESHLTEALVELLSNPTFSHIKAFLGYICKLLDMMIEQRTLSKSSLLPPRIC
jgi:hypothetical protein